MGRGREVGRGVAVPVRVFVTDNATVVEILMVAVGDSVALSGADAVCVGVAVAVAVCVAVRVAVARIRVAVDSTVGSIVVVAKAETVAEGSAVSVGAVVGAGNVVSVEAAVMAAVGESEGGCVPAEVGLETGAFAGIVVRGTSSVGRGGAAQAIKLTRTTTSGKP